MVEKLREQIAERAKAAGMEEELELVSDKALKVTWTTIIKLLFWPVFFRKILHQK